MKYKNSRFNIIEHLPENKFLIFNSFSKAISHIDSSVVNALKTEQYNKIPRDTFEALVSNGYIIDEAIDEINLIKNAYDMYHTATHMKNIVLVPTLACNFKCAYCFEGEKKAYAENSIIDFDVLEKFAEKNFSSGDIIHITLFGGEPLLAFQKTTDFFTYINALSQKKAFSYSSSLVTNGFCLSEEKFQTLKTIWNLNSIQVTIDGNRERHNQTRKLHDGTGTFDTVFQNFVNWIAFCAQNNFKVNTILRVNLKDCSIRDTCELLSLFTIDQRKMFKLYFRPIYNTKAYIEHNGNRIDLPEHYKIAKKCGFTLTTSETLSFFHCEGDGGINQLHIQPDLSVWKCINDSSFSDASIGKIDKKGNLHIDAEKLSKWEQNTPFDDPKCITCKWLPSCWGGCPLSYQKHRQRICPYEKKYNLLRAVYG